MDGENLVQTLNKNGKNLEVDIQVITLDDNLNHPYFSLIELSKDNIYPIGVAKMEAPYTPYISDYWIKYNGVIVISFNLLNLNQQNTNSKEFVQNKLKKQEIERQKALEKMKENGENVQEDKEKKKKYIPRLTNDEYNYSMICKVTRFKQEGNKFIIYFEDLGWKFLQKVPMEFRKTYVAGQYLDDTFQAICEFLGVQFAYSIEDLHEYSFSVDGYSIEKDGQVIEDVPSILTEFGTVEEEDDAGLNDPINEDSGLLDYKKQQEEKDKQNKNKDKENELKRQISQSNDPSAQSNEEDTTANEDEEDKTEQETLQEKLDKFQEEFDEKVLDLFIGNSFYDSDLTSPVMDYGSITITPRAIETASDANMTTVGGTTGDTTNTNGEGGSESSEGSGNGGGGTVGAPGTWGQTAAGSYYLTKEAINRMSPSEAHQRYLDGKNRNIYTSDTMQKLFWRSCWITLT